MLVAVAAALALAPSLDAPSAPREFRGVWVATVDNIDWPSRPGLSESEAKAELDQIVEVASRNNLNAIVFQVRPHGDAMYRSEIEPWSWYLTGEQGKDPGWDPLRYLLEIAHDQGIEVHAWFNPYRAKHPAQDGAYVPEHISNAHPEVVKTYGTFGWMDPSEPFVQDRSFEVFMDVVERYDVDGIHIDDYFYPYPVRDAAGNWVDFPDQPSWERYLAGGGTLARDDWRRANVDAFVERVYRGIKERKPWVKFGISPFGIYRPGIPEGIRAGVDQYAQLYADALKWYREGWCDYYSPQLYWPIAQTPQSYPVLLNWWRENQPANVHLWPGNFTGRTNPNEGNWNAQEVVDQIGITRDQSAGGNVHFSMRAFLNNWNDINVALRSGPYAAPALVPASPWLDGEAPASPEASLDWRTGQLRVTPKAEDGQFVVVYLHEGGEWRLHQVTSLRQARFDLRAEVRRAGVAAVGVSVLDRVNNESPVVVIERAN